MRLVMFQGLTAYCCHTMFQSKVCRSLNKWGESVAAQVCTHYWFCDGSPMTDFTSRCVLPGRGHSLWRPNSVTWFRRGNCAEPMYHMLVPQTFHWIQLCQRSSKGNKATHLSTLKISPQPWAPHLRPDERAGWLAYIYMWCPNVLRPSD